MKKIKLTHGYFTIVDDEDYIRLKKYNWCAYIDKKAGYVRAIRFVTYLDYVITIALPREIMNPKKGFVVDHVNHDTLDNRKINLRNVTYSENLKNRWKGWKEKQGVNYFDKYLYH